MNRMYIAQDILPQSSVGSDHSMVCCKIHIHFQWERSKMFLTKLKPLKVNREVTQSL